MSPALSNVLVTGGAGFIGSNLVDVLLTYGKKVRIADNFSTGSLNFIAHHANNPNLEIIDIDLTCTNAAAQVVNSCDAVFHLAANADVRFGWNHPFRDTQQNLLTTQNLLEACRDQGVRKFIFSSTGSIYGNAMQIPTREDCPFPTQTSLYAASKLAAEGLIGAYAEAGFIEATIFRFVSILGPRYTHGHVFDFVRQLLKDPTRLEILGDGNQTKSYLHVTDCVRALVESLTFTNSLNVLNLGTLEVVTVNQSIDIIQRVMECSPRLQYSGGRQGWVGDNPYILLDTARIISMGWSPTKSVNQSIEETVHWLLNNRWVFDNR